MKKQPKKPAPKPIPCEAWAVVSKAHGHIYTWNVFSTNEGAALRACLLDRVIRVRIVPVATAKAKRRKGAK